MRAARRELSTLPFSLAPLAVVVAAVICTFPSWLQLAGIWRVMADYSHGPIVVLCAAVWLLARSNHLPRYTGRLSPGAAAALLLSIGAWLIAYKAASAIGQQIVIPLILWCALWMSCGLPVARRFAAPIACLYFAIPVWEFLVPFLQRIAVFVSETALAGFGVPVRIEGVLVHIPEGSFEISEGCAGKRYLIVALATATLLAAMRDMRPRRTIAFLAITAALAIFMNWVRVVTVIWAGHVTNMRHYLVAREHLSFGWVLFGVLIAIVCLLGIGLTHHGASYRQRPPAIVSYRPAEPLPHLPMIATMLILCVPIVAMSYAHAGSAYARDTATVTVPRIALDDWQGPRLEDPAWSPNFPEASARLRTAYRGQRADVQVFIAEYDAQRPDAKLIGSANSLLGRDWKVLREDAIARGASGELEAIWAATPRGGRWLITYTYAVHGVATKSPVVAQLVYGTLAWIRATPSRIVAAAIPCKSTCEDTEQEVMGGFWTVVGSRLLEDPPTTTMASSGRF